MIAGTVEGSRRSPLPPGERGTAIAGRTRVVASNGIASDSGGPSARHSANMGPLERLFPLETPLARHTCALMCRFRGVAQWVSVAVSPEWPVVMARQGVLHTWPSYLGGMNGIIQHAGWEDPLGALDARGVPV